jgi:hypothetical protein
MQYRLADPDNQFDPSPTVLIPYSADATGGGQFKYDASAVELDDGRVLYCWSWRLSSDCEIRIGHAASVDAFFTASDSITFDKALITAAGFSSSALQLHGLINADPYVGNARLWLQVYMDRPGDCTFDASVQNPGITLDGQHLWTSVDQGATWDYVQNLWSTQTNRGTIDSFIRLAPPEPLGPGASYTDPYPVGNGLSLIVNSYRQNTSASSYRKAAIYTGSSVDSPWDMQPMFPRTEPPTSTSFDYWRDDALPITTTLANQYDLGWLSRKTTMLHCPMDVALDPSNPNAGQQSSGGRFLGINGGNATGNRSWFCRTADGYVTPTHRITAGQPGSPRNGAAFTIHGYPNRIFWFRSVGTMLFADDPAGWALIDPVGGVGPAVPEQITSPFDETNPIWTGLGGSDGIATNVMKVGDRMAIMWGSRLIGIKLHTPRCQPLPPLHIPYKDWRREKDKRRSMQMALDNTHAVESWAREVFDAGNTSTRLHIPVSNKGYSQYQFWLSVERWTGTLCNRSRVHIPHKRIKSKDETNFLALERWAATVNPNDGPF